VVDVSVALVVREIAVQAGVDRVLEGSAAHLQCLLEPVTYRWHHFLLENVASFSAGSLLPSVVLHHSLEAFLVHVDSHRGPLSRQRQASALGCWLRFRPRRNIQFLDLIFYDFIMNTFMIV